MCNLRVHLDLQLLVLEQMVVVTNEAFAEVQLVCQLHPFLDPEALLIVISFQLDYCNVLYLELPLKIIQKSSTGPACSGAFFNSAVITINVHINGIGSDYLPLPEAPYYQF